MSNFPMAEKAVESLLKIIISLKPPERVAKVRPHLQKLLSHPIIKLLLPHDDAPAMAGTPSNNADLTHIHNTLTALTKAVDSLQTKGNHPSKTAPPSPHTKGKDPSTPLSCTYSAIAGSRPPNLPHHHSETLMGSPTLLLPPWICLLPLNGF